jgi:spermidine/putrescine-binding protein
LAVTEEQFTRDALLRRAGMVGGGLIIGSALAGRAGVATASTSRTELETITALLWPVYGDGPKKALKGRANVKIVPMAAVEDPINKRGTYDIGVNVSGLFPTMQQAGLIHELDQSKIPNLRGLFNNPTLLTHRTSKFAYIDGKVYGVPYGWSSFGITYASGPRPRSLHALLGPAYKGKLGIGDDATSAIMMVARELRLGAGGAPGKLTSKELDEVFAFLNRLKKQARTIIANPYGSYAASYGRGEIVVAFPDFVGTVVATSKAKVHTAISFGPFSYSYIDTLFIAGDRKPTDAMYAFLNAALDPKWALQLGAAYGPVSVIASAEQKLVRAPGVPAPFRNIPAMTASAPMLEWPPLKSSKYASYADWLKRWERFKAS